jgi:hypothetical protein
MAFASNGTSPSQGNLGAAIGGGLAAGLVGAIVWAVVGATTHHSWSLIAVGVGYGVAFGVTKVGRGRGMEFGVTAAIITLISCLVGFLANFYLDLAGFTHQSIGTVIDEVGPSTVISEMLHHAPLTVLFMLLGAFYAFRAAGAGTMTPRRLGSQAGASSAQPPYAPPSYAQPSYAQPSYAQPSYATQPSYGPPASGQSANIEPTYGQPTSGQQTDQQLPDSRPS